MTLADYTVGDSLLTILWFFMFVIWIWLLITVFIDIFRSHDLSGWSKALWVIFIVVLPFLGVLIYLVVRGGKMQERRLEEARQQQQAFHQYVQTVAGSGGAASTADELAKLADLKDRGVISDEEFQRMKADALGQTPA